MHAEHTHSSTMVQFMDWRSIPDSGPDVHAYNYGNIAHVVRFHDRQIVEQVLFPTYRDALEHARRLADEHGCALIEHHPCLKIAPRARWDALVGRLEAIDRVPGPEDDDSLIDECGALAEAIMTMPAPDADAVRWKLDYILNDGSPTTGSYIAEFVAQTVADYHRFLCGRV